MNPCCTSHSNYILVSLALCESIMQNTEQEIDAVEGSLSLPSNILCEHNDHSMTAMVLKLIAEANINSTKFPAISNKESCGHCLSHGKFSDIPGCQCSHPTPFSDMIQTSLQKQQLKTLST